jgi:hypothetical protein
MKNYDWVNVPLDGNCFYSSLCISLGFSSEVTHLMLRRFITEYISDNIRDYTEWFGEEDRLNGWRTALERQKNAGEFVEGPFIQGAADCLNITISIH